MGTLYSSSIIFFAFLGFEFITCLSEESKNPTRDLPLSINLSIGFCCLLYCLIAVSLTGMAQLQFLNPSTAMADAFTLVGMDWMSFVIYVSAFVGITGSVFTKLMVIEFHYIKLFRANLEYYRLMLKMDCSLSRLRNWIQ